MPRNMPDKSVRTLGYVLKRTNYGEADRILNIITPIGKIAAIAKGVRKEKSKLAGGIEMFSLIDFTIHTGRGEFGIVTSAKLLKYYGNILKSYEKLELASGFLKKISRAAEDSDNEEYFRLVEQSLTELDTTTDIRLVRGWFVLNLLRATGEEVNLYRDADGAKLEVDKRYEWDAANEVFQERDGGRYGANEIKMLRLMSKAEIKLVKKVKVNEELIETIMGFIKTIEQ